MTELCNPPCSVVLMQNMDAASPHMWETRCSWSKCRGHGGGGGTKGKKIPRVLRDASTICRFCRHRFCYDHLATGVHECPERQAEQAAAAEAESKREERRQRHVDHSQGGGGGNCAC